MWTQEDRAVAAVHSVDVDHWCWLFDELMSRIGARFGRVEPRRRAGRFVLGLLAGLVRVNCWSIAEHACEGRPDGMQHLLGRARWDAEGVRDDLREYVVEHLGHPDAVLIFDETGDVKKGTETVGVQRQYTGTAGRIENSQVSALAQPVLEGLDGENGGVPDLPFLFGASYVVDAGLSWYCCEPPKPASRRPGRPAPGKRPARPAGADSRA